MAGRTCLPSASPCLPELTTLLSHVNSQLSQAHSPQSMANRRMQSRAKRLTTLRGGLGCGVCKPLAPDYLVMRMGNCVRGVNVCVHASVFAYMHACFKVVCVRVEMDTYPLWAGYGVFFLPPN